MEKSELASVVIVFAIALVFFSALLLSVPAVFGLDAYYNLRYSSLIPKQGLLFEFPWLYFTALNEKFFDQHFLYHIILMPFTLQGNLLLAAQVSGALIAALTIAFIYFLFRKNKVHFAWLFALLLLFASRNFVLRFVEARPIALSILLLFVGAFLIQKRKLIPLFFLSFFFVWIHTTFIVLPIFLLCFLAVSYFEKKEFDWRLFAIVISGTLAGLIVNPYFPANIVHLFTQYFNVAMFRGQQFLNSEWLPPALPEFFLTNSLFFALIVFAVFLYAFRRPKLEFSTKVFLAAFAVFFLLTLKSSRFVDYSIPLGIAFFAFLFKDFLNSESLQSLVPKFSLPSLKQFLSNSRVLLLLFAIALLAVFTAFQTFSTVRVFEERASFDYCAEWLEKNSEQNSIVFNLRFDEFPMLYYYNQHNYYVVGLDEIYLFKLDETLFEKFKLVQQAHSQSYNFIKNDFKAGFVFLSKRSFNKPAYLLMKSQPENFELAAESPSCAVFKVL